MMRNELVGIEEKDRRISNLLVPALSMGIALIFVAFLEAVLVFILSLSEDLLFFDNITQNILVLLITQIGGAIIVFAVLIPFFKVKNIEIRPMSTSSVGITVVLFFLALSTTFLSGLFFTSIFTALNLEPQTGYSDLTITVEHLNNPNSILLFLVAMSIGAALFEEMVCRRLLIPLLEDKQMGSFLAVIASSIVFAMAHLDADIIYGNIIGGIMHTTGVFFLGMMLGMSYILTRNVIFPMLIHGITNLLGALNIIFMLMENKILLTIHSVFVLILLAIGLVITIVYTWKYFRGPETDWILIIKRKSRNKVMREITRFVVVGLSLVYLPSILKIILPLMNVNEIWNRILSMVLLASILVVLLIFVRKKGFGYEE
ncbi:MAG: CPBP family intramembrane glutamic endopeptidase [Candidatus Hodarchaeales archaeon]|jgi:membrane protease YdiL (CAAX protease family)